MGPETQVRCPRCGRVVREADEWRIDRCPDCGEVLVRMSSEPRYD